jgi:hypothetical protein
VTLDDFEYDPLRVLVAFLVIVALVGTVATLQAPAASDAAPKPVAPAWEYVPPDVERLPVPGGWIYRNWMSPKGGMTFVPAPASPLPTEAPK